MFKILYSIFSGLTSTNTILMYEIYATVLPLDDRVIVETPEGFGPP